MILLAILCGNTHFKIGISKACKCMTHVSVALYSFMLLNEFVHLCLTKETYKSLKAWGKV